MKNLFLVLVLALAIGIVACGEKKPDAEPEKVAEPGAMTETESMPTEEVKEPEEAEAGEEIVAEGEMKTEATEETTESKPAVSKGEWTGYVVHFGDAVKGKTAPISKAKAEKMTKRGHVLAFMTGKDFYLVVNTDGSYASKYLLAYAGTENLTIKGKMKSFQGMKYIIAEKFEK